MQITTKNKIFFQNILIKVNSKLKEPLSELRLVLKAKGNLFDIKGALSNLRQFLATESSLKVVKNAFYFTFKVIFVLRFS